MTPKQYREQARRIRAAWYYGKISWATYCKERAALDRWAARQLEARRAGNQIAQSEIVRLWSRE